MSKTYFGCKSTKTYEKAQSAENNKKKQHTGFVELYQQARVIIHTILYK